MQNFDRYGVVELGSDQSVSNFHEKKFYAPGTIDHCERLVNNYNAAAEEYMALAREHERLAANK